MRKNKSLAIALFVLLVSSFAMMSASVLTTFDGRTTQGITLTPVTTSNPLGKLTSGAKGLLGMGSMPIDLIIQTTTPHYAQVTDMVKSFGGVVKSEYVNIEALAISIPASALLDLAASPFVAKIFKDTQRYLLSSKDLIAPTDILFEGDPGIETRIIDIESIGTSPATYINPVLTNADLIWGETGAGAGVTVAIIDTGCWNESWTDPVSNITVFPWYLGNVIGGVDLSYDVGTPYEGYGNPMNHYHGTACAALLAAHVEIVFSDGHSWGESMYYWNPFTWKDVDNNTHVLCFGIAPAASIYAVKIFDHTGGGVPSSLVMDGIDAAISAGVDVISMSLGGLSGAPGEDPTDLLVDAATAGGIAVCVAAGNEGPATLRVGSPGTACTAITVGAAMDPMHERIFGGLAFGLPPEYGEYLWYPHDEYGIVDFSSRGPTSDGRVKPDVVATGSWTFFGLTPQEWPYTIGLGGGTSFSCPQVAGEAALLTAYIKNHGLDLGPLHVKKAIMDGAWEIPGFTEIEQGAGYIDCQASLDILKTMDGTCVSGGCGWPPRSWFGSYWTPPIETLELEGGKVTFGDILLEPGKYEYFAFCVSSEVDSVRITLSGVQLADPADQNPFWGDAGVLYLSTAVREGYDDYYWYGGFFGGDYIFQVATDVTFQPGVVRLVLAGDFSSYEPVYIEEVTIEVVEVRAWGQTRWWNDFIYIQSLGVPVDMAQVSVYPGDILIAQDEIEKGDVHGYMFNIPDDIGFAYVELSWCLDWTKYGTSDLDMVIFGPDGVSVAGATGASPEFDFISGAGDYLILVDGYEVYFDKAESYKLRITYFAEGLSPIWESNYFALYCRFKVIRVPVDGIAVVWVYDTFFGFWYMADHVLF
jgi:subtilisin family serine protease